MLDELSAITPPASFWLNSIGFICFLGFVLWAAFPMDSWPGAKLIRAALNQLGPIHRSELAASKA